MTQLPGIVQGAPNKSLGFDADSVISQATAQQFASQGYKFCIRYLSLSEGEARGDLTYQEALGILQGGLALMPVQHVSAGRTHLKMIQIQEHYRGMDKGK
ncbi:MAG: DUF1906 domain-containing protein [Woronichinia naegeliana WA131]|jgi:hypothetical protein|uniref:DUF1906 domain-containing protein n=1 Tax=Woronichinia naegeliana WA131 TaxID=2824559 RepID=A0A977KZL2_9CYAN|nr:MAG: DUF1906 domain-containing protein [Woronichinia naegeliana WA131]